MSRRPVFQTDDLYDDNRECKCEQPDPRKNGGHDHWWCQHCGFPVPRGHGGRPMSDRPNKKAPAIVDGER